MPFLEACRRAAQSIPIIGGLVDCTMRNHRAALNELLIALSFSTVTFWLSAFFLLFLDSGSYFDHLVDSVRNGELLIFAVGFLGPTLLLALQDGKHRQFPGRRGHTVVLFLVGIMCSGLYALARTLKTSEPSVAFDRERLLFWSLVFGIVVVLLRYLAMVYSKSLLEPEDLRTQEKAFSEQFASHQGKQHGE
jgi:hypothetical protein